MRVTGSDAVAALDGRETTARARVEGRTVRGVGGVRRGGDLAGDIGPCAEAGIDEVVGGQALQGGLILHEVGRLDADRPVPGQAEPGEVPLDGSGVFWVAASGIDVFDTEQEATTATPGALPREDGGSGVAFMEVAGGAGCEPGDRRHGMLKVRRWDAAGKPDCLVVGLHGVDADGSQMEGLVQAWAPALPHAAFLAPDGPEAFDGGSEKSGHRQWFSLRDRTPAVLDAGAARAAPLLQATIAAECARLGVSAARVVLAGFSQGAMMALHAGLRREGTAAILAYSGALLDGPGLADSLAGRPPVLLVHGEPDNVVPFTCGAAAEAALRRLGVPVETCWRPNLGHAVDAVGLAAGARLAARAKSVCAAA